MLNEIFVNNLPSTTNNTVLKLIEMPCSILSPYRNVLFYLWCLSRDRILSSIPIEISCFIFCAYREIVFYPLSLLIFLPVFYLRILSRDRVLSSAPIEISCFIHGAYRGIVFYHRSLSRFHCLSSAHIVMFFLSLAPIEISCSILGPC